MTTEAQIAAWRSTDAPLWAGVERAWDGETLAAADKLEGGVERRVYGTVSGWIGTNGIRGAAVEAHTQPSENVWASVYAETSRGPELRGR